MSEAAGPVAQTDRQTDVGLDHAGLCHCDAHSYKGLRRAAVSLTRVRGVWLSGWSEARGTVSRGCADTCRPEVRDCRCETHEQC